MTVMRRAAVAGTRLVIALLVVASLVFVLTAALPGDSAGTLAGADKGAASAMRAEMGLDRPLQERLLRWWGDVLAGDLGRSWLDRTPVTDMLTARLPATLVVAVPAWLIALGGGWATAVLAAWHRRSVGERVLTLGLAVLAGLPEAVLVVALTFLLATWAGLVPSVSLVEPGDPPWGRPELLVLPVLATATPAYAWAARLLRGAADDAVAQRVVTAAVERGDPTPAVIGRHVAVPMLPAVAQAGAVLVGAVLGGGAVVETLLAYPGLGLLLTQAVGARDMPVVQGVSLLLATAALVAYAGADAIGGRGVDA